MSKIKNWFNKYFWSILLVLMLVSDFFSASSNSVTDKQFLLDVELTIILAISIMIYNVRKDIAKLIENNKK